MAQEGSRLGMLYHDGSGSKLDKLYSGSNDPDRKAAMHERRANRMLERQTKRAARKGDYRAIAALQQMQDRPGFKSQTGIQNSLQQQEVDAETARMRRDKGVKIAGGALAPGSQGAANDVAQQANRGVGTGAGDSPENAAVSSNGGQWVQVGPSATGGAATASGSAQQSSGLPLSFDEQEKVARARSEAEGTFGSKGPLPTFKKDVAAIDVPDKKKPIAPSSSTIANIHEKYAGLGFQDGDLERLTASIAEKGLSPEDKAKSEKVDALIARARENVAADNKLVGETITRPARWAEKDAALAVEAEARQALVDQTAADREVWHQDVLRNAAHAGYNPDGRKNAFSNIKRAFAGVRQDAPMPALDWDKFEKRDKSDPNLGQSRYKSQYEEVETATGVAGKTNKSLRFTGEVFKGDRTNKEGRETGIGIMPRTAEDLKTTAISRESVSLLNKATSRLQESENLRSWFTPSAVIS